MNTPNPHLSGAVKAPMKLSTAPYISPDYAREEKDKLWQMACREEEIPNVADFHTYIIIDQSVIVLRLSEDEVVAYHNACRHRGRWIL
jgi:phenylpropionate dioxygenase-like ring-hydroxylating dioxygenase large terminal subunit